MLPSKLVLTINNLLTDLLICQFFCQVLKFIHGHSIQEEIKQKVQLVRKAQYHYYQEQYNIVDTLPVHDRKQCFHEFLHISIKERLVGTYIVNFTLVKFAFNAKPQFYKKLHHSEIIVIH